MFGKLFGRKRHDKSVGAVATGTGASGRSLSLIIDMAEKNGLIGPNGDFPAIFEIMNASGKASEMLLNILRSAPPMYRETLMHHSCRYLWGKTVEAVFLWAKNPHGNITINFEPEEMARQTLSTQLPQHLEEIVLSSMDDFLPYFQMHQAAMMANQHKMRPEEVQKEIQDTLEFFPHIAMLYAIRKGYHETCW